MSLQSFVSHVLYVSADVFPHGYCCVRLRVQAQLDGSSLLLFVMYLLLPASPGSLQVTLFFMQNSLIK